MGTPEERLRERGRVPDQEIILYDVSSRAPRPALGFTAGVSRLPLSPRVISFCCNIVGRGVCGDYFMCKDEGVKYELYL